jgi:hypothetical protein
MTDITAASVTNVSGSSAQTTGRNHDVWGAREVGLYRVALTSSAPAGGFTFDPKTYGFQNVVASVVVTQHILVANAAKMRYLFFYDYVNKKIVPADITDSFDDAAGDDLSLITLDVIVLGE